MENVKKLTKRAGFEMVLGLLNEVEHEHKEELIAMVKNEIELLNKKATAKSQKDLEKAKVDNEMAEIVYNTLVAEGVAKTATELLEILKATYETLNVQKVTHLLTNLLAEEKVKKEIIKRKSYYTAI